MWRCWWCHNIKSIPNVAFDYRFNTSVSYFCQFCVVNLGHLRFRTKHRLLLDILWYWFTEDAFLSCFNNRSDDLDKKAPAECERKTTSDVQGSPEYLPPSAKIKRLASKEMPSLEEGSSKSSVCNTEINSQAARTASKEMSAAEKLTLIREKQEKIEQVLVLLESSVKRGQRLPA